MSERGSFVTQYIYCRRCAEAAKEILCDDRKGLCSQSILSWETHPQPTELPIIAGKVGGLYAGEEIDLFRDVLIPALEAKICHNVTIAVLPNNAEGEILTARPRIKPSSQ